MCGIAGFWSDPQRDDQAVGSLRSMACLIDHRGPDDAGYWTDGRAGIALGHRRLAIVDLSPNGHQPMRSASGRYVVVFNGEIYNFRALRRELERDLAAPHWRGHSDTEVMLAAIERWGVRNAVERFAGMFAFAVWDSHEQLLYLVRDRLGIKPCYYGWANGTFVFGSELKALRAHSAFDRTVSLDAVASFLRYDYIPGPQSIYCNARKLPPGTILRVRSPHRAAEPEVYWSAEAAALNGAASPFRGTPDDAVDALDALLDSVVAEHAIADVPLGAFLSGGVDSSLVVGLLQRRSQHPVQTFSIGFEEDRFDESRYAAAVAAHFGTVHTGVRITADDAASVIPLIPRMYDEPFADSSQLPTYIVSALARRSVTVSLSGDGGDELFSGYTRYPWTARHWSRIRRVPYAARHAIASMVRVIPESVLDGALSPLRYMGSRALARHARGARVHALSRYLDAATGDAMYDSVMSHTDPVRTLQRSVARPGRSHPAISPLVSDPTARMRIADMMSYLPDDILVKVDRASMAVSLETRVPLLDHRIVEFAWRMPASFHVRGGITKWPLRMVLSRYLPRQLFDRPKSGFSIPVSAWLRGPLRAWAADMLAPASIAATGLLDPKYVARRWNDHLAGHADNGWTLWNMLMLEAWMREERVAHYAGASTHVAVA